MDENAISNALNMIPYGFYAVTSRAGDDRNVMVLNWFSQVSFERNESRDSTSSRSRRVLIPQGRFRI